MADLSVLEPSIKRFWSGFKVKRAGRTGQENGVEQESNCTSCSGIRRLCLGADMLPPCLVRAPSVETTAA